MSTSDSAADRPGAPDAVRAAPAAPTEPTETTDTEQKESDEQVLTLLSVAPGADPALDALVARVEREGLDDLKASSTLRAAGVSAPRTAAALSQAELRRAAADKFGPRAASMLFTRAGMEQATRWQVAQHHADTVAAAGITHVTDVGCGLGADAHALAQTVGAVTAIEADPLTAAAARHNLAGSPASVVNDLAGPGLTPPTDVPDGQWGLWFDPARRTGVADATGRARRVSGPDQLQPSLDLVVHLAGRAALTGCKVGPGWRHRDIPAGAHAQWVSHAGDLVEAVLWMGPALERLPHLPAAERSATRLAADGTVLAHAHSLPPGQAGSAERSPVLSGQDELGALLWEPDPALAQAGLVDLLTGDGAREVGPDVGWLTADHPGDQAWVRTHRVVEVMTARPKVVSAWARRTDVGELVLRKHGTSVDPVAFRRQVRTPGSRRAVLLLTRVGDRPVAIELGP